MKCSRSLARRGWNRKKERRPLSQIRSSSSSSSKKEKKEKKKKEKKEVEKKERKKKSGRKKNAHNAVISVFDLPISLWGYYMGSVRCAHRLHVHHVR